MGKQTDQLIKACNDALLATTLPAHTVAALNDRISKLSAQGAKLYEAHKVRLQQMEKEMGLRPGADDPELEQRLETDPAMKKIDAASAQIGNELDQLMTRRIAEKKNLVTAGKALRTATNALKTFVEKKEKSKNPFKSKKSVPEAKRIVKLMEGHLGDLNGLL